MCNLQVVICCHKLTENYQMIFAVSVVQSFKVFQLLIVVLLIEAAVDQQPPCSMR